jgi:hypothetical protein
VKYGLEMPTPDNATWFHNLAAEFGRHKKLKAVIVQDGPNAFRVRYGSKADGKALYEVFVDFVAERASLLSRDVPYAEVEHVFKSGMQEQFSPFDDGPSRPTRHDIRTWLELRCRGKPMID